MKLYRKVAFLLSVCLTFLLIPMKKDFIIARGEINNSSNLEVAFVLDASKSMEASDPENLRIEALKLFIDMCHVKGDKIGLVAYGSNIVKQIDVKEMQSQADKESFKLNCSQIPPSLATDIGLGIKQAVTLMDGGHENGKNPVIILLSDGKNDPERSKTESDMDIINSIKAAREKGYKIYTIGLNYDGTVDKALLAKMSADTGGKSFIINSANELPVIFGEIFAESSQLKMISGGVTQCTGGFQETAINIPNSNVVEANISVISQNKVELMLVNSKGVTQYIPSDKIYYSASKKYSILKIITPIEGWWVLRVKGTSGDSIKINYIFNYNLQLDVSYTPKSNLKVGDVLKVDAFLKSNFRKLEDEDIYKQLKGKLIIKNNKTGAVTETDLTNTGNGFKGQFNLLDEDNYELKVRIDGNSLFRESEPKIIGVNNRTLEVNNKIEEIKLSLKDKKVIDLTNVFSDPSKQQLAYTVSVDPPNIARVVNGGKNLTIIPLAKGSALVTITAQDANGATAKFDVALNVEDKLSLMDKLSEIKKLPIFKGLPDYTIPGIGGILLLLILLLIISKAQKRKRRAKKYSKSKGPDRKFIGQLMVSIKDERTGNVFPPFIRRLDLYEDSVTLRQLVSELPEFKETEKIRITPGWDGNIVITNDSNCDMEKINGEINSKKRCVAKNEEKVTIKLTNIPKVILLQYFATQSEAE